MDNDTPRPYRPEVVLHYRIFSGLSHVASTKHPEDAAELASRWGSNTIVTYKGHDVAQVDVNNTPPRMILESIETAAREIDAAIEARA